MELVRPVSCRKSKLISFFSLFGCSAYKQTYVYVIIVDFCFCFRTKATDRVSQSVLHVRGGAVEICAKNFHRRPNKLAKNRHSVISIIMDIWLYLIMYLISSWELLKPLKLLLHNLKPPINN